MGNLIDLLKLIGSLVDRMIYCTNLIKDLPTLLISNHCDFLCYSKNRSCNDFPFSHFHLML